MKDRSIMESSNSPDHSWRDGCANQKLSWTESVAQPPPAVVKDLKGKNTSGVSGEGMTLVVPKASEKKRTLALATV